MRFAKKICFALLGVLAVGFAIGSIVTNDFDVTKLISPEACMLAFGAISVRSADQVAEKWAAKAAASGGDYKDGIAFSGNAWQENTAAAKQNYADGVQAAIARDAFADGVAGAGGKWKAKAETLGAQRFSPGVAAAKNDFRNGVGPALDVIRNTTLPPRFPKGDPRNAERTRVMNENLRKFATGQ